jgi:prepilin-type N-terminal cleavage/methylation domain-containing protein
MKRNEKGFTLIELIIVIAIASLIVNAAGMSIFQILNGTEHNNDHATAVRQVQNAGHWISQDAQRSQVIDNENNPATGITEFITFTWTTWEDNYSHEVIYIFEEITEDLADLKRQYTTYDDEGSEVSSVTTKIAGNITEPVSFQYLNGTWTLTITSMAGELTETRKYEIISRIS